jgi:Tol biopolymer transport system component/DNA-binding winged helix-turn-helix (wHTH) protein
MSNPNSMQNNKLFGFSVFRLNTNDGLFVNSKQVKLAPKVFRTLILFVENKGRVISKDELFEKIWEGAFVEESAISFNISKLRQALAEYDKQTVFIETIPKRGFRFNADVIELDFESAETEIIYEKHQIQEVIIEEINQEQSAKLGLLPKSESWVKIYFPLLSVFLLLPISLFAVWQWQKNNELRSFDSLQTVKLTSWKSVGSSFQSKYSVSNNGNLFAYSSIKNEHEEIFIKQISGGEDVQLFNDKFDNSGPVWSPDDTRIAFVSVRDNQIGVYICPAFGGNTVLQKIVGKDKVSLVKWSNDGTKIYYEVKGNLFFVNLENKEVSQVTDFIETFVDKNFSFSKDEKYVAYCNKTADQTDIWVKDLPDGVPFQITDDKNIESDLVWHPDSKRILYGVNRNGHNQINVGFINKEKPLQITGTDDEYKLLDVSPDGTKVFYISWQEKSDIWSIETENGKETKISKEEDAEFWTDISPDGKLLSYQINSMPNAISRRNESSIVIKSINQNTKEISIKGINQKWLPDSRKISFLRWESENKRYNLWTFDVIGGEEKKITTEGVGVSGFALMPYNRSETSDFSWSNAGIQVVYADSKRQNMLRTSLDSNETTGLTDNNDKNLTFYCPIWSKDGKKVIFVSELKPANSTEKRIYSVLLFEEGNLKTVFSGNNPLRLLGWAESNNEFYCLSTAGLMKSRPIDAKLLRLSITGESKILRSFEQISLLSSVLLPDGKKFAFTKREENKDNIYLAGTETNETKKITENADTETLFGSLSGSPDGKQIFYDKQEKINVISVIDNFK